MKPLTIKDISCSYDERRPDKIDLGDGYYAVVSLPYDEDHGAPWDECDCHGPVRDSGAASGGDAMSGDPYGPRPSTAQRSAFRRI